MAKFDAADIRRLMADESIIRSRAKIEATIGGARALSGDAGRRRGPCHIRLGDGWRKSDTWRRDHRSRQYTVVDGISAALKKRGYKFVGPVIVYAWMQAVGIVDDHSITCFRRAAKEVKKRPPKKKAPVA